MAGNQEKFQNFMNQGHSAAWDQDWEQAAAYYQQARAEFPENVAALTSLGLALYEQRLYEPALDCYQNASKMTPDDAVPWEKMGRIYERIGKVSEAAGAFENAADLYLKTREAGKAVDCWQRVIRLKPDDQSPRTRLAMIYERMGRKAEAVSEYIATASLMQHAGDITRARQVLEYCTQIMPDNPDVRQALILVRNNQMLPKVRRLRGATASVRMAEVNRLQPSQEEAQRQLDPVAETRQRALVRMAALLFEQNDEALAGKTPLSGVARTTNTGSLSPRISMHLSQAIEYQTHGDEAQAAKELERAVEAGLNHAAVFFNLGQIHLRKDNKKSLRFLQKACKHPDFALASALLMGQIYQQEGNMQEAAAAMMRALSLADAATAAPIPAESILPLYEPLIEAQTQANDPARFEKLYENVFSQLMRPDWRKLLEMVRQQMPAPGANDQAPILAEVLLESGSSQVVEALAMIRQLADRHLVHTAMEEAYYALQYAPTYLPLHVQIGELLHQEGRSQEALTKFNLVAELYHLRGETSQAIRLLERVTEISPMELEIRSRLISLLVEQGRMKEAIQQNIGKAEIIYQMADLDQARAEYASALRLAQQHNVDRSLKVQILYKIADIDLQKLDLRQAVRIFEQIRTLEPLDATARLRLVDINFRLGLDNAAISEAEGFITLLDSAGKQARSIDFMKNLVNEQPEKIELRKRLADLYVRSGAIPLAVEQLDGVAEALLTAGNRNGAINMLQAIISMNPPNVADYRMALEKLRSGAK